MTLKIVSKRRKGKKSYNEVEKLLLYWGDEAIAPKAIYRRLVS